MARAGAIRDSSEASDSSVLKKSLEKHAINQASLDQTASNGINVQPENHGSRRGWFLRMQTMGKLSWQVGAREGGQSSWRMDDKPTVGGRDAAFELQGCIYCVSAFRHTAATRRALIPGRDMTHAIHGVRPAGGVPPSKSAVLPICRTRVRIKSSHHRIKERALSCDRALSFIWR